MSPTDGRQDRQTERRTMWLQYTPSNSVGRGMINKNDILAHEATETHFVKVKDNHLWRFSGVAISQDVNIVNMLLLANPTVLRTTILGYVHQSADSASSRNCNTRALGICIIEIMKWGITTYHCIAPTRSVISNTCHVGLEIQSHQYLPHCFVTFPWPFCYSVTWTMLNSISKFQLHSRIGSSQRESNQ